MKVGVGRVWGRWRPRPGLGTNLTHPNSGCLKGRGSGPGCALQRVHRAQGHLGLPPGATWFNPSVKMLLLCQILTLTFHCCVSSRCCVVQYSSKTLVGIPKSSKCVWIFVGGTNAIKELQPETTRTIVPLMGSPAERKRRLDARKFIMKPRITLLFVSSVLIGNYLSYITNMTFTMCQMRQKSLLKTYSRGKPQHSLLENNM